MHVSSNRFPNDAVFDELDSPVGRLLIIASRQGLHTLTWGDERAGHEGLPREPTHPVIAATRAQLGEYFRGERRAFDLPLAPRGTPFQQTAWQALLRIPYGATLSYEAQARALGDARKARAVGTANGKNPIGIVIPCHRVITKDGGLGGFAGGLSNKRLLLDLEQRNRSTPPREDSLAGAGSG